MISVGYDPGTGRVTLLDLGPPVRLFTMSPEDAAAVSRQLASLLAAGSQAPDETIDPAAEIG